jgi:hypothetical protein
MNKNEVEHFRVGIICGWVLNDPFRMLESGDFLKADRSVDQNRCPQLRPVLA